MWHPTPGEAEAGSAPLIHPPTGKALSARLAAGGFLVYDRPMGWVHVHVMESKDPITLTGVCRACGPVRLKRKGRRLLCHVSQWRWRNTTWSNGKNRGKYRKVKAATCSRCGFVPEHPRQLDVDHINGDHTDDRLENLRTLCANCHRVVPHPANWRA